jgi:hypothetical protein
MSTLVLVVGPERKDWQIVLGVILAVVVVFTRINLAPFLPVVLFYIYWQHGSRIGHWALAAAVLLTVLIIVWLAPDIFNFWPIRKGINLIGLQYLASEPPVDGSVLEEEDPYRAVFQFEPDARQKLRSILDGFQIHYLSWMGLWGAVLGLPAFIKYRKEIPFKSIVFLTLLFLSLVGFSIYGTILRGYCVFCLRNYYAFFMPLGILLFAVVIYAFYKSRERNYIPAVVTVLGFAGLGYAAAYKIGDDILALPIPWPGGEGWQTIELWAPFANKFGLSYDLLEWLLPILLGALLGLVLVAVNFGAVRYLLVKKQGGIVPSQTVLGVGFAVLALLSNTVVIFDPVDMDLVCDNNVIDLYEEIGGQLSAAIPEDAFVFWHGGNATVLFLEIPQANVFPPLINMYSSFGYGGNKEELLWRGYWNEDAAVDWLETADFLIVNENYMEQGFVNDLIYAEIESGRYQWVLTTPVMQDCKLDEALLLYQRVSP